MTGPKPQSAIMDIALYQGGGSTLAGFDDVLKLSSNENPAGPAPAAVAAMARAADHMNRYPSTDHSDLRAAIAEVNGMDPDRIICGQGSDEIIAFLCYAYGGQGAEVINTQHGFSMYRISALASGATPVEVAETNRCVDVEKILDGVTDATRLVFIANPGNPTGTMIGGQDLRRLADGLPDHVVLVLDGAYAEFSDDYDGGVALVEDRENVVMTRTFSKLYGLGGLRVGWGYGPKAIIDVLNRVRGPFNLGNTQLAAAEAAVRDQDWAQANARENARMRGWMAGRLAAIGIPSDPSQANFILARFADADEADAADQHLKSKGIIVRKVPGYGFPQALRITVGLEADCGRVVDALTEFKGTGT